MHVRSMIHSWSFGLYTDFNKIIVCHGVRNVLLPKNVYSTHEIVNVIAIMNSSFTIVTLMTLV